MTNTHTQNTAIVEEKSVEHRRSWLATHAVGLAAVGAALALVGTAFAFLTATAKQDNTFTFGNVEVSAAESKSIDKLEPNQGINLDADIKVLRGSENSYVFAEVTIPRADIDNTAGTTEELFKQTDFTPHPDWTLVATGKDNTKADADNNVYVYAYTKSNSRTGANVNMTAVNGFGADGKPGGEGANADQDARLGSPITGGWYNSDAAKKATEGSKELTVRVYAIQASYLGGHTSEYAVGGGSVMKNAGEVLDFYGSLTSSNAKAENLGLSPADLTKVTS